MEIIEICRMVARSLVAEIGPWGERCAFFGGLAPGFLMPQPPFPLSPHIGTRDVDLAIGLAALSEDREMYRTLKNNLTELGLSQDATSFKWKRSVEGVSVEVELFVPVDDPAQAGRIQKKPIEKGGSSLTALGIFGLDLITRDICEVEDEGPLLDGRGIKRVCFKVCGPAMLVALKAWALNDRNKPKDGYDTIWTLRAFGVDSVAQRFREAGLIETEFGQKALEFLEKNFASADHTGPMGWVLESHFEGNERAIEGRNAVGIVREFLKAVRGS